MGPISQYRPGSFRPNYGAFSQGVSNMAASMADAAKIEAEATMRMGEQIGGAVENVVGGYLEKKKRKEQETAANGFMESLLPQMFPDFQSYQNDSGFYAPAGPNGESGTNQQPSAELIEQYANQNNLSSTGRTLLTLGLDPGARKDFMKVVGADKAPAMVMDMLGQMEARNAEKEAAAAEQDWRLRELIAENNRFFAREDRLAREGIRDDNLEQLRVDIAAAAQAVNESEFEREGRRAKPGALYRLPEEYGGGLTRAYTNSLSKRTVVMLPNGEALAIEDIPGIMLESDGSDSVTFYNGNGEEESIGLIEPSNLEIPTTPDVEKSVYFSPFSKEDLRGAFTLGGTGALFKAGAGALIGEDSGTTVQRIKQNFKAFETQLVQAYVNAFDDRTAAAERAYFRENFAPKVGNPLVGPAGAASKINALSKYIENQIQQVRTEQENLTPPSDPTDTRAIDAYNQQMASLNNSLSMYANLLNEANSFLNILGPEALVGAEAAAALEAEKKEKKPIPEEVWNQ